MRVASWNYVNRLLSIWYCLRLCITILLTHWFINIFTFSIQARYLYATIIPTFWTPIAPNHSRSPHPHYPPSNFFLFLKFPNYPPNYFYLILFFFFFLQITHTPSNLLFLIFSITQSISFAYCLYYYMSIHSL